MHLSRLCSLPSYLGDLLPKTNKTTTTTNVFRRLFASLRRRCFCRGCLPPCCCGTSILNRYQHDGDDEYVVHSLFEDISGADGGASSRKAAYDNPRLFSYAELYIGSNGFSADELLGAGGFGRVYRAVLPSDGTVVAVKCVASGGGYHVEKTFAAELVAVAQLRHRNLVRLRGWCVHDDQLLLVYDYMPNSSLDRVLFGSGTGGSSVAALPPLKWQRRERIVAGLAAALFYLHEQLETQIIHRDVKTSNVMLDSGYNARLGDFGLARWLEHGGPDAVAAAATTKSSTRDLSIRSSSMNTNFRLTDSSKIGGTIGYVPPESFERSSSSSSNSGSAVTAKSDVFSFGIVVLEVATGRRAIDLTYPDDEIVLVDWVRRLADDGEWPLAADRRLPEKSYRMSDVRRLLHLGLLCSLHHPSTRPDMKWVNEILTGNYSGDLPPLPSFKSDPHSVSPSLSSVVLTKYYTATTNSTIYLTAETRVASSSPTPKLLPQYHRQQSSLLPQVDTPREIPFKEIAAITKNFSEDQMVAELDFGTGYFGFLDDRRIPVLVKRLGMKTCPALRARFSDELRNLARLRHRHLVQLRGWCTEQGEMLVVYDYPSSTLLSKRLFHNQQQYQAAAALPWRNRYSLVKSLASAVLYLHEEWDEQVIHRNITSSAIFLDHDMSPRLGSFALAEFLSRNEHGGGHHQAQAQVHAQPSVRGIFGYMAPEYMESGIATTKGDVYSFGVVVLEVVSGRTAVDFRWPEVLLARRARGVGGRGRSVEEATVDWRLQAAREYEPGELRRLVRVGLACTRSDPERRPSMREVVSVLDGNEEVMTAKGMGGAEESREEWDACNGASLDLIRRIHAIGIQ